MIRCLHLDHRSIRHRRARMAAAAHPPAPANSLDSMNVVDDSPLDAKALEARKKEPEANKLFRMVMKMQASDLHLKVGQPPMMRLRGDIRRADMRPLSQEDMERLLLP